MQPIQHPEPQPLQIPLSQAKAALVDPDNHLYLSGFRWAYKAGRNGARGYAVRHAKLEGGGYRLSYLHREVAQPSEGQEVIFLNHDSLDCRKSNLHVVTKEEARRHHRVRSDSDSGIKGIRFNDKAGTWGAAFYRNGVCHHVGSFWTRGEAIAAYETAVKVYQEKIANTDPDADTSMS